MTIKVIVDREKITGFETMKDAQDFASEYRAAGSKVLVIYNMRQR
jgi:hypothetical protein